ncbi:MAG: hypothetical protein ACXW5U_29600 [Thermoanaerobaculia bacterium]
MILMIVSSNAADNLLTMCSGSTEIVDAKGFGLCHVCGTWQKLTREHVPPRAAFNDSPRLWERLSSGENVSSTRFRVRCGLYVITLCQRCNGNSPHAREYVRFAKALAEKPKLFDSHGYRRLVYIAQDTSLLAKQIAVMILAVEPALFGKRHDYLRRFVLQERATAVDPEFRIFGFLVPDRPEAGTLLRAQHRMDGSGEGFDLSAGEISGYPFGFVYGWHIGRGYSPEGLTDITSWFAGSSAGDRGRIESFDCRVTVIESLQAIYQGCRAAPQVDYLS